MLPSFDVNINFTKSDDYRRCILLTHIAAAILVLLASFPILLQILFLVTLYLSELNTRHQLTPQQHFAKLTWVKPFWRLCHTNGEQTKFDSIHILFDGGFFLLLLLVNSRSKKRLLIFNDQITLYQHRLFKVLSYVK